MTPILLLLATAAGWQIPQDTVRPAAPADSVGLVVGPSSVVSAADTAALVVHGSTVVVFRGSLGAASPMERAEAAARRIDAVITQGRIDSLRIASVAEGVLVQAGDRPLFLIIRADGNAALGETPTHLATRAVVALRDAMEQEGRERSFGFLLRAGLLALLATVLFALSVRLLRKAARAALTSVPALTRRVPALTIRGFTLLRPRQVAQFVRRTIVVAVWCVGGILAYIWLTYVLTRFPVSRPWGEALGGFLLGTVRDLVLGALGAVPGLITVLIIFILVRSIGRLVSGFFAAVEAGRVEVPWVHADTAQPTRRIVLALLWIFAIVVAYPYLPGSGSDVFKGVSVFLGVVLSLGSTGLVNQAMSGLVLMYARSFRPGDYVRIGDVEGVVTNLALLSTKIRTTKNEEVTIPNAAIVAGGTKNFTRLAEESGVILYTSVSIGYDTPWRQVHALLSLAASRTDGLRREPAPFVLYTALSDFYVEYQLNAWLEHPEQRVPVLSALHSNVLDAFNEYGVQIMSPHFERQPKEPVLVPQDRWRPPPVDPQASPSGEGRSR